MKLALAKQITKKCKVVVMRLYLNNGYWYASTVNGDKKVSDLLRENV